MLEHKPSVQRREEHVEADGQKVGEENFCTKAPQQKSQSLQKASVGGAMAWGKTLPKWLSSRQ